MCMVWNEKPAELAAVGLVLRDTDLEVLDRGERMCGWLYCFCVY